MIRRLGGYMPFVLLILAIGFVGTLFFPSVDTGAEQFPCGPKVLVFHAKWCRACPTTQEINELQTQFPKVEVVDVDIDKHPDLKTKYHVNRVPLFQLCDKSGCRVTKDWGELKRWLAEYQ